MFGQICPDVHYQINRSYYFFTTVNKFTLVLLGDINLLIINLNTSVT